MSTCDACGAPAHGRRLQGRRAPDCADAIVCDGCCKVTGDFDAYWDGIYARIRARRQQQEKPGIGSTAPWVHHCRAVAARVQIPTGLDCAHCGLTYEQAKERAKYPVPSYAAAMAEAAVMHEAAPASEGWCSHCGCGSKRFAHLPTCPTLREGAVIDAEFHEVCEDLECEPVPMPSLRGKLTCVERCKCHFFVGGSATCKLCGLTGEECAQWEEALWDANAVPRADALAEVERQCALLARVTLDLRMLELLAPGMLRGDLRRSVGAEP